MLRLTGDGVAWPAPDLTNLEDLRSQLANRQTMVLIGASGLAMWLALPQNPFSLIVFVFLAGLLSLGLSVSTLMALRPADNKQPEHEAKPFLLCLSFLFIVQIIESLLHRLPKPLPEGLWIEAEEFLVERTNCVLVIRHKQKFALIAIGNTNKTGKLVN